MKKYCILILLFFYSSLYGQWINQNSGVTNNLYDIKFINKYTGWICGNNVILKTTNGGDNWFQQYNPAVGKNLKRIYPVDSNVVYCVGIFETILKTTNGGDNWMIIRNAPSITGYNFFESLFFLNSKTGWMSGNLPYMLKTTDGCQTFDSIPITEWDTQDIYFKDSINGILCGEGASILKSTDGGFNWYYVNFNFSAYYNFYELSVINNQYCWAGGSVSYKSTNFGDDWDSLSYLSNYTLGCIEFVNENTGWTGGDLNRLYKTTNGGITWRQENTGPTMNGISGLHFYDSLIGWLTQTQGRIMHTTTGGEPLTQIINNKEEISEKFILEQNYPNPFNLMTTIQFQVPSSKFVKLVVYDLLGKEVKTLVDEFKLAGTYEARFDGNCLQSGIYFYSLYLNDKIIQTKKLVLIK
jgi:photosystem II stability/assembly factor-like uncharacterized protein